MQLLPKYLLVETFRQRVNSHLSHLSHEGPLLSTLHLVINSEGPLLLKLLPECLCIFLPPRKAAITSAGIRSLPHPKGFWDDSWSLFRSKQPFFLWSVVFGMVTLNGSSSSFSSAPIIRMLVVISCPLVWTSLPGFLGTTLGEMISSARLLRPKNSPQETWCPMWSKRID